MRNLPVGMARVPVNVVPPYQVWVGANALAALADAVPHKQVALLTDENVGPLHASAARERLREGGADRVELVQVAAGEESKGLGTYGQVLSRLAAAGLQRDGAVVALGGGVVTDLGGFVAASYLRGVAFYACPTSMLAMVDASVGGKTGLNLPEGKNLVGAFWQPRAVFADVALLESLPEKLFREGAVELFKHGLLGAPELLAAVRDPEFRPGGPAATLERYIARSVEVKAAVVAGDEREAGKRAHLNLGHSLAHALEAASGHRLSHGEAVAYGLLYAALLGRNRGWHDFSRQARELLAWLSPSPLPPYDFEEVLPYMLRDKKNSAEGQRFILLDPQKQPVAVADVSSDEQRLAWEQLLEEATC